MIIDRVLQKQKAKELIRTAKPSLILAGMIYVLLSVLIGWLSLRLTGVDSDTAMRVMDLVSNGKTDAAMTLINRSMPGAGESLIDVLLRLALSVVGVGFSLFVLNAVRGAGPALGNLLDGFGMMPRLLLLLILEYVFVFLWSLLFVVPGIIAAYRYRFAVYLMLDHPEYGAMECIQKSKEMTYGYKMQLFLLDLSFILWGIASAIPGIGYLVQLYFTPYRETVQVLYYEEVRLSSLGTGGYENG